MAGAELRKGTSKSCGHNTNSFKDLRGQLFGKWKPLEYMGNRQWKCECTGCGTIQICDTEALLRGLTKQCLQCRNTEKTIDLTGKHFGEWEVLKKSKDKPNYWLCKCTKCGKTVEVHGYSLRSGKSTSCGCNGKTPLQMKIFSDIDLLREHIDSLSAQLGHKPSSYELAESLGVNYNLVNRKIHDNEAIKSMMTIGDKHISNIEKLIFDTVKIVCPDAEQSVRNIIGTKEVDIYIPSKKVAIEFNGDYWHSTIFKDKYYHRNKSLNAIKNGARLIHIFEYEWNDQNTRNKIGEPLSNILVEPRVIIGARETIVKTVENEVYKQFIEKYHLQGYVKSSIVYGLYTKENELIAVMSFGKPRFIEGFDYELLRLAYKNGVKVIGGASKLLNAFITNYKPNSILTYCDISKFTGKVYQDIGFKLNNDIPIEPGYVWVKIGGSLVYSRYETTKQKLIDKGFGFLGDTENEIMENLGFCKVYNSGNIRFEWRRDV